MTIENEIKKLRESIDCLTNAIIEYKEPVIKVAPIKKNMEVNKMKIENLDNQLFEAAYKNSVEVAELLIEKGADVNCKNNLGRTPLHEAAIENSVEVAKLLIKQGADVNSKNNWGRTPLHVAALNKSVEVAKLLIENGANINAKSKCGTTPLHWAAIKNSVEVAKLLIKEGADIHAKDNWGRTPLYYAELLEKHNVEVAELLKKQKEEDKMEKKELLI